MKTHTIKAIVEAANNHDVVVVYTQDEVLVRSYLYDEPGRWNVAVNERFWDRPAFEDRKSCNGQVMAEHKIGLLKGGSPCDVGLDSMSSSTKVVFTKNVFFDIPKSAFVIKDEFSYPGVKCKETFPYYMAIHNSKKPLAIFTDSLGEYHDLHDSLSINNIEHSLASSESHADVHLSCSTEYLNGFSDAVVYGFTAFKDFCALHLFDKVTIVMSNQITSEITFDGCQKALDALRSMPNHALSTERVGAVSGLDVRSAGKVLSFLSSNGFASRLWCDDGVVEISKVGDQPKNDPLFCSIPVGRMGLKAVMAATGTQRESVMPMLKSYEKNGLVFAYQKKLNNRMWCYSKPMSYEAYESAVATEDLFSRLVIDLSEGDEGFINTLLERIIEGRCSVTKSRAEFYKDDKLVGGVGE